MAHLFSKKIVSLFATISLGGGVIAVAGAPATAATVAQVSNCDELTTKPTELVLACADANEMLTEMTWSGWSAGRATGKGRYEVNDCEPTCVAGTVRSYPVQIRLLVPKAQNGVRVFTKVALTFTKKTPSGKKKMMRTLARYSPQSAAPTPAPSANADSGAAASASPSPTLTPSPSISATPSPSPSATPSPTPSATTAAIAAPVVAIESRKRVAGGSVKYILSARSKARGGNYGVTAVTGYQANEYGAELASKGTYLGIDYGSGTSWEVTFSCATNRGDDVRIVVRATDGQTTMIREKRAC